MINEKRVLDYFLELVRIDSPSTHEEKIAEKLEEDLKELGLEIALHDDIHNLVAWLPGRGSRADDDWLMLSAHTDTVGQDTGIKPVIRDGVVYSDGTTILGGDDKSGVAAIMEVLRTLAEHPEVSHLPLEIVFSVQEEIGLIGAKRLRDTWEFKSQQGVVLDTGGPIGAIVVSAPTQQSITAVVHGKASHAGAEPERGVSAIQAAATAIVAMHLGRIDKETTANVGVIKGGTATNIIPDRVEMYGEARSHDEVKLNRQIASMQQALEDAVARFPGASVDVEITPEYKGFRLAAETPIIRTLADAAKRAGFEPRLVVEGGGSDANIYNEAGLSVAVVSTGMADVHTPKEHLAVSDLVGCTKWMWTLVAG